MIDLSDRTTLLRTLPHGGRVVEVGVERGLFARVILAENQPRELILVDAWAHQPGTEWEELDPAARLDLEENYRTVQSLFAADPRVRIIRALSVEAAAALPDSYFDIIYIDADHTRAGEDMRAWWPKVKPGGWLCGHDYTDGLFAWVTVKRDVDAWIAETGLPLQLTHDRWPSWSVRKPWPASGIALVITVYPPQAYLLEPSIEAIEKYWPGHPALAIGQDMQTEMAARLLADLRNVETEFVVTLNEDFCLCAPVKQDLFDECLTMMQADPLLLSCSLTWEPSDVDVYHFPKRRYADHFQIIPKRWDYAVNFQMRIWRRAQLMQILENIPPGTTNADLEPLATGLYRRLLPRYKTITYAFPNPPKPSIFVDSTDKSAWIVAYNNVIHAGRRLHYPDQRVPIFITNFNRLTTTRKLVDYLSSIHGAVPIIVDNASTYPPLLEWYEACPCEIIRLPENRKKLAPWTLNDRRMAEQAYVVTDPDLDLTDVPADLLQVLQSGLQQYPAATKAGLSLEIDDLPVEFESTAVIQKWERRFWQKRLDARWFDAPIDTTFAMYRAGSSYQGVEHAIRSDRPYTARHMPWYRIDSEEERYYDQGTDRTTTYWNGWDLPLEQRPAYKQLKAALAL